jgi:hypothetical protein
MSGLTPPPPVQGFTTCQGSAATMATPSVDPAAAILLQLYLECVTARGWCRVAFEMRCGLQHFDFSYQPLPTSNLRTPQKRRAHARRRAQESLRRAAWAERRRNRRSRPSGCPDEEVAVTATAFIAALETATTASCPTTAANIAPASATTALQRLQQLQPQQHQPQQQLQHLMRQLQPQKQQPPQQQQLQGQLQQQQPTTAACALQLRRKQHEQRAMARERLRARPHPPRLQSASGSASRQVSQQAI